MTTEPLTGIPYVVEGQANAHATVNDAINTLAFMSVHAVESEGDTTEPGSPTNGQGWIVGAGPYTGDGWTDSELALAEHDVAYYYDGWRKITHTEGLLFRVKDTNTLREATGTGWEDA